MTTWDERMGPRQRLEPRLERVEMCWRLRSQQKATRILECGVYRTDAGLEVRCGFGPDDLLRSQTAPEIGTAREIAEQWRQAVLRAKGGFEQIGPEEA